MLGWFLGGYGVGVLMLVGVGDGYSVGRFCFLCVSFIARLPAGRFEREGDFL